jgi:cold shock CspA family protein
MAEHLVGQVKWFNRKAGYGYIRVLSTNQDVFVHHSGIQTKESIFKYLVDGETVRLRVVANIDDHRQKATEVQAVEGAKLMCEIHFEQRRDQNERNHSDKTNRYSVKQGNQAASSDNAPPRRGRPTTAAGPAAAAGEWLLSKEECVDLLVRSLQQPQPRPRRTRKTDQN